MTDGKTRPPNIVLVVLDAHRQDPLGCYGDPRGTSPHIDRFAESATLFEAAIAPAQWTIPSHASMFTGTAPTTHRVVQSKDALPDSLPTMAERLQEAGYHTVGFCNNPLVGVLSNGFRRGFDEFFNFGGAFAAPPLFSKPPERMGLVRRAIRIVLDRIRRVGDWVGDKVASSGPILRFFLHPRLVPWWTKFVRFKGQTARSIHELTHYLRGHTASADERPCFTFMNLMEVHLPYGPPRRLVKRFAPIVATNHEAARFARYYSTMAMLWLLPMAEPYSDLEAETLRQLYGAEVAYQDECLGELFAEMDRPEHRDNTLLIITSDHGEMLGEHQFMGHGLSVHRELVRVPLIIREPGQTEPRRVRETISTTRLFDTVLAAAGIPSQGRSLLANGGPEPVMVEAYSPTNVTDILERRSPELIARFHARSTYRAIYRGLLKLIQVEDGPESLYDTRADPTEDNPLDLGLNAGHLSLMRAQLAELIEKATAARTGESPRQRDDADDELMKEHLRGLGYIE